MNPVIEKLKKCTIAEARTSLFGDNLHLQPGSAAWYMNADNKIRAMKDEIKDDVKKARKVEEQKITHSQY